MTWGLVVAGVAGVAGAAIASNGAQSAANTQAAAAGRATDAQERMFNKQVELQQPWLNAGQQGLNRLQYLMGIAPEQKTRDQLIEELRPKYTVNDPRNSNGIDDIGLNAEVQRRLADQQSFAQGASTAGGPAGSLLKPFSQADFQSDPGYQFRQSEGEKGLQRAASAQGGIGSGRFLKDAMNFNQGLASQDYGAAFDRFNVGQANQFNRLASVSGIGQTAANQTGAAASNFGSQIGSNIIGAGNALAAGQVGGANAYNNAIGQGVSMYQQNSLMNRLFPQGGYYDSGAGISPPNPYYQG